MTSSIQSFVHDPHPNISNEETFSSNSDAKGSELLENLEMFPLYYMNNNMLKSATTK